jgi:hypothetical protein
MWLSWLANVVPNDRPTAAKDVDYILLKYWTYTDTRRRVFGSEDKQT